AKLRSQPVGRRTFIALAAVTLAFHPAAWLLVVAGVVAIACLASGIAGAWGFVAGILYNGIAVGTGWAIASASLVPSSPKRGRVEVAIQAAVAVTALICFGIGFRVHHDATGWTLSRSAWHLLLWSADGRSVLWATFVDWTPVGWAVRASRSEH